VVDGSLMVLSPWTVRSVRFDEGLRVGYGFDTDYCRQVRGAGRRTLPAIEAIRADEVLDEGARVRGAFGRGLRGPQRDGRLRARAGEHEEGHRPGCARGQPALPGPNF